MDLNFEFEDFDFNSDWNNEGKTCPAHRIKIGEAILRLSRLKKENRIPT